MKSRCAFREKVLQRKREASRYVCSGVLLLLLIPFFTHAIHTVYADTGGVERYQSSYLERVVEQVSRIWSVAKETADSIFAGDVFRITQIGNTTGVVLVNSGETPVLTRSSARSAFFPSTDFSSGSLVINTPLLIDNSFSVQGEVRLATTTIAGSMVATDGLFGTLTVRGRFAVEALSVLSETVTGQLVVQDEAQINSLLVSALARIESLEVLASTTLATVSVREWLRVGGALEALGGITTEGADINLGSGQLFASNVVNEVLAGDNVTITGTRNNPIVSFEPEPFDGVTSINGQSGMVSFKEGEDITINNLTIRNTSSLSSVRSRGGCPSCILDADVTDALTIANGVIDATPIGLSTAERAVFTSVAIGTSTSSTTLTVGGAVEVSDRLVVAGSATSTFGGTIDLADGCFAINGTCVVSASPTTYLSLTDTPGAFSVGALQYVNASGTALTQSSNLVFLNGNLGIGTSTPSERLTIVGTTTLFGQLTVASSATSTFAGGIDVTDGCVAVNGLCIENGVNLLSQMNDVTVTSPLQGQLLGFSGFEWNNIATSSLGLGNGSYLGLSDTPETLTAQAIQFANASGTAVTQSNNFVFDGSRLSVGGGTFLSTLTISGDISVASNNELRLYNLANSHYAGFQASSTLASSTVWTLPSADGGANQLLVTDGQSNLRFVSLADVGGGITTYLGLLDTPDNFIPGSIPFTNVAGNALSHSSNLVFNNDRLGIGLDNPDENLTVFGSVKFRSSGTQVGLSYNPSTNRVGIGTASSTDLLTVQGGSITQRGGFAGATYSLPILSGLTLPANGNDITVVGNYAYVVSGQTGTDFHVIDISSATNPAVVASTSLPAAANALTVQGRYAYIVTDVTGADFHVIDIINPLSPAIVAEIELPTTANAVQVQGRYAFVGTAGISDNFIVIDITNPLAPQYVTAITLDDGVNGIAIANNYAYAVTSIQNDDFHVIDISDPRDPVEVRSIGLPDTANDVVVRGRYAYVTTNAVGNDFHVIDVLNPLLATEIASLQLPTAANGLFVTGRYAYVTSNADGNDLHVIDVNNPLSPVEVGAVDIAAGNALSVFVTGRYAYVTSAVVGNAFHIIDVSGAELQSAVVHSLSGGSLSISGNTVVAGRLSAGLGVRAGYEGLQTDGVLSVLGSDFSYISGSVGIGTTTASTSKLSVAGYIQSSELLGGSMTLSTDEYGNIIRSASDARLKTNVRSINNALATVLELRGVEYEWLDTARFGSGAEIGFVAQEVDLLVPQVVRKGGEYWSLNTQNLVAIVVEAIKELWQVVQGNKEQIEILERRVELLEAELEMSATQSLGSSGALDAESIYGQDTDPAVSTEEHVGTSGGGEQAVEEGGDEGPAGEVSEEEMASDTEIDIAPRVSLSGAQAELGEIVPDEDESNSISLEDTSTTNSSVSDNTDNDIKVHDSIEEQSNL